jgi:hypothetical protein
VSTVFQCFDEVIGFIPARFCVTNRRIPRGCRSTRTNMDCTTPGDPCSVDPVRPSVEARFLSALDDAAVIAVILNFPSRKGNATRHWPGLRERVYRKSAVPEGVTGHRYPLTWPAPRELSPQSMAAWLIRSFHGAPMALLFQKNRYLELRHG